MKSKFILLAFFLLLLLALAGCGKTGATDAAGKKIYPPDEQGYVMIDGEEKKLEKGNYFWELKKGLSSEVIQTDAASPNQIAENVEAISAPPDTEMSFKLVGDPTITVYLWNEQDREKEIELQDEKFHTPTEKGRYIYEVLAKWDNGEISYTYVIELE
ncbi:hypothetical protein ACFVAD_21380 [Sutcliffiella sp. NPDC057660]|uniref:hypothetical protein n=1 Tax=Sutcliffiella sp. NPDC057660 TaxID=3346199 RepID=UPI00368402C0